MAYPLFMFGAIAVAAGAGDRRMIRAGGVRGAARLRGRQNVGGIAAKHAPACAPRVEVSSALAEVS
jgi:hypothetical protein